MPLCGDIDLDAAQLPREHAAGIRGSREDGTSEHREEMLTLQDHIGGAEKAGKASLNWRTRTFSQTQLTRDEGDHPRDHIAVE